MTDSEVPYLAPCDDRRVPARAKKGDRPTGGTAVPVIAAPRATSRAQPDVPASTARSIAEPRKRVGRSNGATLSVICHDPLASTGASISATTPSATPHRAGAAHPWPSEGVECWCLADGPGAPDHRPAAIVGWRWSPLVSVSGPDQVALVWQTDRTGRTTPVARVRRLLIPGGSEPPRTLLLPRITLAWLYDLLEEEAGEHPVALRLVPDARLRRWCLRLLTDHRERACPSTTNPTRLLEATATLLGLTPPMLSLDADDLKAGQNGVRRIAAGAPLAAAVDDAASRAHSRHRVDELIAAEPGATLELDHRPLLQELLLRQAAGEPAADLAWLTIDALAESILEALDLRRGHDAASDTPASAPIPSAPPQGEEDSHTYELRESPGPRKYAEVALFPSVLGLPTLHQRLSARLRAFGYLRKTPPASAKE